MCARILSVSEHFERAHNFFSLDIDECTEKLHDCDNENGYCINVSGAFRCACKGGYTGDGRTCTGACQLIIFSVTTTYLSLRSTIKRVTRISVILTLIFALFSIVILIKNLNWRKSRHSVLFTALLQKKPEKTLIVIILLTCQPKPPPAAPSSGTAN